jgi:formylglycine-generating enzyme required for sulfatase activity
MRFYCLEDNKDFYREVSWGTRVICDVGPHDLGQRFPDEPFWEHCGHCEATWVAREQGTSPRAICPGCKRKLELAYLCHICETFCLRYAEDIDQDGDLTNAAPPCGACSTDLSSLRWHYCVNLGKPFLSKRDQCPLCDASFFPITAQDLLSSMKGHSYQLARISDVDREYLSLVPASIDSPDEIQFFVLGGVQGAIVVPRYTTRSMIEQRARKYQQVFDWSTEWTGDILIERPAIFEFAGKGWRLKKHGKLTGVATEGQEVQPPPPNISECAAGSPGQKPNDHENEHSIEQSGQAVQGEPTSNFVISPNLLNQKSSNESKTSERTTFADSQGTPQKAAAEPFRAKAKSLYRNFVAGGSVTNNLVYLDFKKSASKQGLKNTDESLKEVTSEGAFVVFVCDENQGWVFPNPKLIFNADSLKPLFAALTAEQFDNFKEHIEPVPVIRVGKDRWQVPPSANHFSDSRSGKSIPKESKAPTTAKVAVGFPIAAADYIAKMRGSLTVVRHDMVRNFLVSGPDGKGELALICEVTALDTKSLFVVPRITPFLTTDAFYNLYERYYDCAKPSLGDVWIINPAVVSEVPGGWKLRNKGVLEVRRHQEKEKTALPSPPKEIRVNHGAKPGPVLDPVVEALLEPALAPHFADTTRTRRLILGGVIAILSLIAVTVWIVNRFTSIPSPSENVNQNTPLKNPSRNPGSVPSGMVRIESGTFTMGRTDGNELERPAHSVSINKPFFIERYEVKCQDYEAFLVVNPKIPAPIGWKDRKCPAGKEEWPVSGVDWYGADAYAKSKGRRLPTEEEWEYVARGGDKNLLYPWGNSWEENAANAASTSPGHIVKGGSYPAGAAVVSGIRVLDMVGNVWEWTSSDLTSYGGSLPKRLSSGQKVWAGKVIRGGAWNDTENTATTTYRVGYPPRGAGDYSNTGFRCVVDVPPP